MRLSQFTGEELLRMWKESGLSQRAFARKHGFSFNAMHGKIFRAQNQEERLGDDNGRVKFEENGNTLHINSDGPRITSVDQLVKEHGIDTGVWNIYKSRHETYEGFRKDRQVDMQWNGGKADGYVKDQGKINTVTLHIVEIWAVKKEPVPIKPVLAPVRFGAPVIRLDKPEPAGFKKALEIPDPQIGFRRNLDTGELEPYHDRAAMSTVLSLASDVRFDKIVLMGDYHDFANLSMKYLRSPEYFMTVKPAIVEGAWFLWMLRRLQPDAQIDFMGGNHDQRMIDFRIKHLFESIGLKQAFSLEDPDVMSQAFLMDFRGLGINYVGDYPLGESWITENTKVIHGTKVRNKSGATAAAVLEDQVVTTIFGHIHRIETATKTLRDRYGQYTIQAVSPGCLCKIDGSVPGSDQNNNWQQGFAVTFYDGGIQERTNTYEIFDGQVLFNGQIYKGYDYREQLSEEMEYKF